MARMTFEIAWLDFAGNTLMTETVDKPTMGAAILWARRNACQNKEWCAAGFNIKPIGE